MGHKRATDIVKGYRATLIYIAVVTTLILLMQLREAGWT